MSPRTVFITPMSSAAPASGGSGACSTCGTCQRPASTVAATMAMDSKLIRTVPWPMVCAARPAWPAALGTEPEKAGTCSPDQSAPMPNSLTTWVHSVAVRRSDNWANAVPQPSAKAVLNGLCSPVPSLEKVCPPTLKELAHGIEVDSDTPFFSTSAAADTMVNAAPGASFAFSAPSGGSDPDAWCWATARPSPVDARTATISPEFGMPSRAARAASCTLESIVVRTGVPAEPCHWARTAVCWPAEFIATTSVVGVPSSSR